MTDSNLKTFNKETTVSFRKKEAETNKVSLPCRELNNDLMGGLAGGEVAYILAEAGRGKSIFIDCWALNTALHFKKYQPEKWVYLFLLEQDSEIRSKRMALSYHGIDIKNAASHEHLSLPPMNLIMVDTEQLSKCSVEGIADFVDEHAEKYPPGLVLVDYLGNLDSLLGQAYSEFMIEAKKLERWVAIKHQVPVASGAQAIKGDDFSYETMYLDNRNIADCKALARSSSLFLSINQNRIQKESNLATLHVFKNRRGPVPANYNVYYDPATMYIGDLDNDENK